MKAGRSVYRCTLAEPVEALGRAEREGRLPEKIRYLSRNALLIVDEIGYLPITPGGANLFFQLVNARYAQHLMADRERSIPSICNELGHISASTLYHYLYADGALKEPGQKLLAS